MATFTNSLFAALRSVAKWHERDIARSRMDVRFRGKSGHAADITGMTELDPKRSFGGDGMSYFEQMINVVGNLDFAGDP